MDSIDELISSFVDSGEAKASFLKEHPELLEDATIDRLRQMANQAVDDSEHWLLLGNSWLLDRAGKVGPDQALLELQEGRLQQILLPELFDSLRSLSDPATTIDARETLKLCRHAMRFTSIRTAPFRCALLQARLGKSLCMLGDRNLGTATLRNALTTFPQHMHAIHWAQASMWLAEELGWIHDTPSDADQEESIIISKEALTALEREAVELDAGAPIIGCSDFLDPIQMDDDYRSQALQEARLLGATCRLRLGVAIHRSSKGNKQDNLEEAISFLTSAMREARLQGDEYTITVAKMNLSAAYREFRRGNSAKNFERSISLGLEVISELDRQRDSTNFATAHMNLVISFDERVMGDRSENVESALGHHQIALSAIDKERAPRDWALIHMNRATTYLQRICGDRHNNVINAIRDCQAALIVFNRERHPIEYARTSMTMGIAWLKNSSAIRMNNVRLALIYFGHALEVFTPENRPSDWAGVQINLAAAYKELGEMDDSYIQKAIVHTEYALDVFQRSEDQDSCAIAKSNLAGLRLRLLGVDQDHSLSRAIQEMKEVLNIWTADRSPTRHVQSLKELGRLYFISGRWTDAVDALRLALKQQQLLYRVAGTDEFRRGTIQLIRGIPAGLAYCLAKLGGQENLWEAVRVAEEGRGKLLRDSLNLDRVDERKLSEEDQAALQTLRQRNQSLLTEARHLEATKRRVTPELSAQLRANFAALDALVASIPRYKPDFLDEDSSESIKRIGAAGVELVYLLSTAHGGFALHVDTKCEIRVIWLPKLATLELQERVNEYLEAYRDQSSHRKWSQGLESTLEWLWESIIEPLREKIPGGSKVCFVPGGALAILPIHAARSKVEPEVNRAYALDLFNICYAPSAQAIVSSLDSSGWESIDNILAIEQPLPVTGRFLPNAEIEIIEAVRSFTFATLLRHEQASRESVRAKISECQVLHFAGHGVYDAFEPLNSGLVMARDEVLSLNDLLQLRLSNIQIAVLSACESGVTGLDMPDESRSLPGSLIQAGVKRVVASLWLVADESTMMLMTKFYESWRGEHLSFSPSLRNAQRWLRDTTNEEKKRYFESRLNGASEEGVRVIENIIQRLNAKDPTIRGHQDPIHWAAFAYTGI